jgi:branched-chain amino acid transport system ATP-binding protein
VTTPLLEVAGLGRRFGRVVVAEDVSFSVAGGEVLGVVGPNGAGKSTLLNLISGVLAPDRGSIRLGEHDVTRQGAAARARAGVGRTYQIPRPFAKMTVFENALVGATFAGRRRGEAADLALSALRRTGLLAHANEPAGGLRLLDRKRLELARALAGRPALLLLDEIAGGLAEH